MSDERVLQFSGRVTVADMVRFNYCHAQAMVLVTVFVQILALAGLVVVAGAEREGAWANPGGSYLMMLGLGFLMHVSIYSTARKQHRALPYMQNPITYRFSGDGASSTGAGVSGEMSWASVPRVRETKTMFLIYQGPQLAWILPKRFFADGAALEDFRAFVIGHLRERKMFQEPSLLGCWL